VDPDRFNSIKIITQGYDYAIPSYKKSFGIQMLMDNGEYLKEPMMMNGINDPYLQQAIMKAITFEMNEMLIELGKEYDNVYHIDARGITAYYAKYKGKKPGYYWFDELHPKSEIFGIIADVYTDIINNKIPAGQRVVNVIDAFSKKINSKK
jgi:cell division protein YceG involved in septum cleavage